MPQHVTIHISPKSILLLIASGVLIWFVIEFSSLLLMLFLAILLAVAITPGVEKLERWHIPRPLAIVLIYIGLGGVASLAIGVLIPVLIDQISQLRSTLPSTISEILSWPQHLLSTFFPTSSSPENLVQQFSESLSAVLGNTASLLVTLGSTLTTIFFDVLLVMVVCFILASEAKFSQHVLVRFFPPHMRPLAAKLMHEMGARLGHWVRAQLLICLIYGTAFGIGLRLVGVPYAFALGLAAAVLELIPYIGGASVTAVAVLVALSISPLTVLAVLLVYVVVAAIESNILYPKVVGESVGVHPLVVIIALFIGAELLGVMGALLAVPCTVVLQVLFEQFYRFEESSGLADSVPAAAEPAPAPAPTLPPHPES